MAKLKSEVLQKKYDEGKITFREKAISSNVNMVPKMAGWKAPFVNFVQGTAIFKYAAEKILKVDRRVHYHHMPMNLWRHGIKTIINLMEAKIK
jgi:hypothetical protein